MDLGQIVEEFRRHGFVRIPELLSEGELRALRHDTQLIIDGGYEEVANPTDYRTAPDPDTGEEVFNRVQFVFPLAATEPNPLLALLGHPQVQALAHALLGDGALCNAEALVFKLPGNGSEVPVHADCQPTGARPTPTWDSTSTSISTTRPWRTAACWRLPAATWRATPATRSRPPGSTFRACSRFPCAPAMSWFTISAWSTAPTEAGAGTCAVPFTTSSSPWAGCSARGCARARTRASTTPGPGRGFGSRGMPSRPARRVPTRRRRLRSTTGSHRDSRSSRTPGRTP